MDIILALSWLSLDFYLVYTKIKSSLDFGYLFDNQKNTQRSQLFSIMAITLICLSGDKDAYASLMRDSKYCDEDVDAVTIDRMSLSNLKLQSLPSHMSKFLNITYLNISFNRLADISAVQNFQFLRLLDASHNKIISLEMLPSSLEILRCQNNELESLNGINNLQHLTELWLSFNNISWLEFGNLLGVADLRILNKQRNPCDDKANFLDFLFAIKPTLQIIDGETYDSSIFCDFFKSANGRLMANQLRTHVTPELRAHFRNFINEREPAKQAQNVKTKVIAQIRNDSPRSPRSPRLHSHSETIDESIIEDTKHLRIYPAVKKKTDNNRNHSHLLPKKFIPDNDPQNHIDERDIAKIIRFGSGDEDPVAFCLYKNGSGYARYGDAKDLSILFVFSKVI